MKPAYFIAICLAAQGQDAGARLFASRCAQCHGADGAGGEHAPSITESQNLRDTVKNGIPEKGMPAFAFTASEMDALVAHVKTLRAAAIPRPALPKVSSSVDWPTYHGQLSGNRHSELKQINASNIMRLAPAWLAPVVNAKRLEGTPIVIAGIMYVTTANECFALDAKNGKQLWHYARPLTKGVIGDAASAINRGVAVLRDRLYMITDHAHMIALNRWTGELIWDTEMADYRKHFGATGAPLVVGNLVLSGTSGGDEGAPGFIAAYYADTGNEAWRFQTIKPDSWIGRAAEHGCVDAWLTGTYDPSTDLIFWPTGNPCPDYNGDERKGDNLYANSVVALEPTTGKLRWHYQFTPHDLHDWDAVQPLLAVDGVFKGKPRKLLLQANRNGYFYVLDRTNGEFLMGQPFVKKTDWADGIDEKGRPRTRASATPTPEGTKTCPNVIGGTNWFSSAYNDGLFYVMAQESCGIYTKSPTWFEQGKSFYGGTERHVPGEKAERFLRAIDIQTGKIAWEIPAGGSGWGGVLSTAGGLVFYCDETGTFAAADAKSGKPLWHFDVNQSWHASPMTYEVDGRQYVAVAAGSNFIAFALNAGDNVNLH